uniref:Glutamine-dependent NAD(+) synthetase n=1 Tax=Caldilinea aerophila TaxID=133453 RepID=A0A7C1JTM9_9CHLR
MDHLNRLFVRRSLGYVRVASISPALRVADVDYNVDQIALALKQAQAQGVQLAIFPELCITAYSCADLFYQRRLLDAAIEGLRRVAEESARLFISCVVGLPVLVRGRLYNCAALVSAGRIVGIVPKTYLPTTGEFYEQRWFTPGDRSLPPTLELAGQPTALGIDLLFVAEEMPACVVGIEICEDLWAVEPPSGRLALAGATLLVNPSASNELLGKADYRRDLVRQQSARCLAAYIYAGAGNGESTTDVVYGGHCLIAENGQLLAESERFQMDTQMIVADVDIERLEHERLKNSPFSQASNVAGLRCIPFSLALTEQPAAPLVNRPLSRTPFVPADPARRAEHCREIFNIQTMGLVKRLHHTGASRVTLGISGGLDSTLALLVCVRAFDRLGLNRTDIMAITMPGFGTTVRTRNNAERLAQELGVTLRTIPIAASVRQHFQDIGHDEAVHDVTYENAQARERTQILMDVANQIGGLVVGTGDLSEAALGWMTFNGDHMSMYHVNAGVPKTLVRYLVSWCAEEVFTGAIADVLRDIVETPITPELLPLREDEQLAQKTEEAIGPYELHDFFLFQVVRHQFAPLKVFFLARQVFADVYDDKTILHWLEVFYRRFFAQQFKRSSMPDGPKVGSVALSPRGDWRMPSDASSALWTAQLTWLSERIS